MIGLDAMEAKRNDRYQDPVKAIPINLTTEFIASENAHCLFHMVLDGHTNPHKN